MWTQTRRHSCWSGRVQSCKLCGGALKCKTLVGRVQRHRGPTAGAQSGIRSANHLVVEAASYHQQVRVDHDSSGGYAAEKDCPPGFGVFDGHARCQDWRCHPRPRGWLLVLAAVRRFSPLPLGHWHPGADTHQRLFFNDEKGFGFVVQDNGGPELFVHRNGVSGGGLLEGDLVQFDEIIDDRTGKLKATNVTGGTGGESWGRPGKGGGKKGFGGGGFGDGFDS